MKRIIAILFLLPAVLTRLASAEPPREIVKIGLIYPLTGTMSSFGEDMAKAIPLLEQKFNVEQSKYDFKLLMEDGKFGQGNAAITAAKKLVEVDGVKFIVVGSSGETLQIAPYVESSHVLAVGGFSSHPDIKKAGDYIFRTYFDIEPGIKLVADDMIQRKLLRIAVITEQASFTSAVNKALADMLRDKIVSSQEFSAGDVDLKTLIAKAKNMKPDAYYLNTAAPGTFIVLMKQIRAAGISEPFYTFYVPSVKEVQDALGSKLNGVRFLDFPDTPDSSDDFRNFLSVFESKNGAVKAPFNFRTNYNAAKIVYDAIVAAGPDPKNAKDFLYNYDRPSATGRLRFDENGDARDLNLKLKSYGAVQ